MTQVISVKFKDSGKNYYFSPDDKIYTTGQSVIVETANGLAFGTVAQGNHEVEDEVVVPPLKKALRVANEKDMQRLQENKQKEADAFDVCERKITAHKLDMKLVRVEYSFDGGKITFFFTADGRVDFRELVKDLANHFHSRIELRQIGVRDEARMLGGVGICGQEYCCKRFLDDFLPVSIKMAKEQSLSLNPTKISGSCGRLMCCLNYEQESYEYLNSITPHIGATVKTEQGVGVVIDVNFLTGSLTVKPKENDGIPYKTNRKNVKILGGHKPKKAEETQE
ncbi:MAG: stage 0 sporulation family protein [Clostridia bacterium]|nr:stage 0 sporulation family protein [Clostridia bacterium]